MAMSRQPVFEPHFNVLWSNIQNLRDLRRIDLFYVP